MKQWSLINELAEALLVSQGTRRQWKMRGTVPHRWRLPLLALARRRRKRLSPRAFDGEASK